QGPGNYVVIVRATEKNTAALSSSRSFGLTVSEVNQTPKLDPVTDLVVEEGTVARFFASASDADLPAQKLTFALEGAVPPGATIDGNTGEFVWPVPADTGASTNTIIVKVADNGPGSLNALRSFKVIVTPKFSVVIHEIMYRPAAANAEYVELHNASAVTTWNLAGFRLAGENLNFTFPNGSVLAPGGFLCVVRNAFAFVGAYGGAPRVAGVWTGNLGLGGDYLQILPPPPDDRSLSAVRYTAALPWPAAANGGGASLQLIDDRRDPARVANWSGAPAYTGPRQLIVMTNLWRYFQSGPVDATWKDPGFNDAAWPQGRGLLYKEEADLPAPKSTLLTIGQKSYYFRTSFVLPSVPAGASLSLSTVIDDGAVFYLNGIEVYRQNIAANVEVNFDTPATPNVTDAVLTGPFTLPADALRAGTNTFTVEVHQSGVGSSDIVMGCSLNLEGGNLPGFTPGASNNVASTRTEFPAVWLNEVLANNTTGIRDRVGEREPWIELVNTGLTEVALDGWSLSDNYTNLAKWKFPAGTRIPAGGFLTIFADGEVADGNESELHTSFRLGAGSGSVALARPVPGASELADFMEYAGLTANEAYAALPDGQPFARGKTTIPTPTAPNSPSQANQAPVLDPIGARVVDEDQILSFNARATDPDAGQQLAYSLVGAVPRGMTLQSATGALSWAPTEADGPSVVNVTVRVTDNGIPPRSDEETFSISVKEVNRAPTVTPIPEQPAQVGQLLTYSVAAQDLDFPAQTLTYSLEGAPNTMTIGASSGLLSWTPANTDVGTVHGTVRVSDNGSPAKSATTPLTVVVSGATFAVSGGVGSDGALKLVWASQTGVNYRVEMVSSLGAQWSLLATVPGTGATMTYSVPLDRTPPRYFRVVIP
ncbi:MAG TPA: hypothetical protein DCE44_13115, partial [Verrucomicrobiales bacterium]|nr:hypothetical protein [Verrucomicrobiales bacterium]